MITITPKFNEFFEGIINLKCKEVKKLRF